MFKLFVYGTLKRGQRNHRHLADKSNGYAAFMGEARLVRPHAVVVTLSTLFATPYKAPRLLPEMPPDKPANIVKGELYEVDASKLAVLDEFERHPNRFLRKTTQCIITDPSEQCSLSSGDQVDCEVYFFNRVEPELYSLPYISNFNDEEFVDS